MKQSESWQLLDSLVGEKLRYVDVMLGTEDEECVLMLTTESGRTLKFHHYRECCESVEIENTEGNWLRIIGRPIVKTDYILERSDDDNPMVNSWTRTTLIFCTDRHTVTTVWFGESNGYYGEEIEITELENYVRQPMR